MEMLYVLLGTNSLSLAIIYYLFRKNQAAAANKEKIKTLEETLASVREQLEIALRSRKPSVDRLRDGDY